MVRTWGGTRYVRHARGRTYSAWGRPCASGTYDAQEDITRSPCVQYGGPGTSCQHRLSHHERLEASRVGGVAERQPAESPDAAQGEHAQRAASLTASSVLTARAAACVAPARAALTHAAAAAAAAAVARAVAAAAVARAVAAAAAATTAAAAAHLLRL